jgi:hypothetical protein
MAKNYSTDSDFETDTTGGSTGSRFSGLGSSASGQIDNSPLIALGAGLALGAVLGAVLPTSDRERELLGPYGRKLNDASTGAIDRGRDLAKQKFDEMAGDKVREFLGSSSSSKA